MEKKRLDENTIQVIIGQDDLDERGITMLDLLGNQKQIEDFFYSVLEEVDTDHQFKKNDSVTFQALPIKDGLELIISKNVNKTTPASGMNQISQMIANQLKGHDSKVATNGGQPNKDNEKIEESVANTFVIKFADFEDFIELANVLTDDDLASDLYLYHGSYYLVIQNISNQSLASDATLDYQAVANEYGDIVKITPAILEEHGKRIMRQSALDTARYYFK